MSSQSQKAKFDAARQRAMQVPIVGNRARLDTGVSNYTIAPRSTVGTGPRLRAPGQSGDAMVRRLKMKQGAKGR
jgi:hypothetical protein